MSSTTKQPVGEAETQNLLENWIRARRAIWNAWYGIAVAHAPLPLSRFLDWSAEPYARMFESALKVQAAGVGAVMRTLQDNSLAALWIDGVRRFAEAAADVQRKSAEAWFGAFCELHPAARHPEEPPAVPAAQDVKWRSGTHPERRGENRAFAKKQATKASY